LGYGFFWIGNLLGMRLVLNMHGVGRHTHSEMKDVVGRVTVKSYFLNKHCRIEASPGKA